MKRMRTLMLQFSENTAWPLAINTHIPWYLFDILLRPQYVFVHVCLCVTEHFCVCAFMPTVSKQTLTRGCVNIVPVGRKASASSD